VSVLYTCIPPPSVNPIASSGQYFLKQDSVKIGMFSQIRTTKGQEDAVLAVSECIKNGLNVELLIVGEAPDQTYLNYLMSLAVDLNIKDSIIFTGYSKNPFDLMALCDIVVMASRLEAFGRVGVEAMLLNKPVVFANTGGISEYQLDGQTGLSYAPGDSLALAGQLKLLINDPALRNKMGITGRLHALDLFSKKNFSERVYFDAKKIANEGRGDCKSPTIIDALIQGAIKSVNSEKKYKKFVGRNEVCPCNSGKKYKYCCGIVG
jgi:glycosyltransferase involved in cell wall biosynthesis